MARWRAARALVGAARVLIVTGFVVAEGRHVGDGRAARSGVLGRALRRLGAEVRYVTDPVAVPLLEARCRRSTSPLDVFAYPDGPDAAAAGAGRASSPTTWWRSSARAGRARGDYLNARGLSVAAWNRPLDEMFSAASGVPAGRRRVTSASGMGATRSAWATYGTRLAREGR